MFQHLTLACAIAVSVVVISNFFVLDLTQSVMYAAVPYMRIYYFLFMLLGAVVAVREEKEVSSLKAGGYAVFGLVAYYACMWIYKVDPFYCNFQIVLLLPLLFSIYWIYRFCDTLWVNRIFEKRIGRFIYFISNLTLEIYMVQYAVFTDEMNGIFPFNIIIVYLFIFSAAYVLRCLSQVFSQIFNDNKFCIEKVYKM